MGIEEKTKKVIQIYLYRRGKKSIVLLSTVWISHQACFYAYKLCCIVALKIPKRHCYLIRSMNKYMFSVKTFHTTLKKVFFLDVVSVQFYVELMMLIPLLIPKWNLPKSEHRIAKHILLFYLEMLSEGALCYWRHTYRRLSTTEEWTQIQIHKYTNTQIHAQHNMHVVRHRHWI